MAYSTDIPAAFPALYQDGWIDALQQKSARSRPYVTTYRVNGLSRRFQKVGKSSTTAITTRFGETNPHEIGIDYRTLSIGFKKDAIRLDKREMIQLGEIGDLRTPALNAMKFGFFRDMDATLVNGLIGTAYEGPTGNIPVAFPASQEIPVGYVYSGSAVNSGLTYDKINRIIEMFANANVTGQDVEGYSNIVLFITARQLTDLRNQDRFVNSRYVDIKPIANPGGNIYELMGITLVVLDQSLLPKDANDIRTCVAYAKEYAAFGVAEDMDFHIDQLIDGNYDWQLYAEAGWGATRLFDEGVIKVFCDESP